MGEDRFRQVNANCFHGLTLRLVNGHSKCQLQGELAPLQGDGHFERFVIVVMRCMLKIFLACATINLYARRQMIRRVPLQSPEATSKFLSKIIGSPTLRARRCGGIPTSVMVLRNFVLISIAWSSPVSIESTDKNTCSHSGTALAI
jgi:hypothetical protein